jgi:hypothetical protein
VVGGNGVQIKAQVSDRIRTVVFLLKHNLEDLVSRQLGVDFEPPYSMTWDTTSLPDGSYQLYAIAGDRASSNSWYSPEVPVTVDNSPPVPQFRRGDANADGKIDPLDPLIILSFLYRGEPETLDCPDAADANDDGRINVTDGVRVLNYLFNEDPTMAEIPLPGPVSVGVDPTADELGCERYPPAP